MKKILIIAILSVGIFSMSNAQIMRYDLNNQSGDTWAITMDHAGTAPSGVETGITSPSQRIGQIGNNLSTFAFPIVLSVESIPGCYGTATVASPDSGNISIVCADNSTVYYRITEESPGLYLLQVRFN